MNQFEGRTQPLHYTNSVNNVTAVVPTDYMLIDATVAPYGSDVNVASTVAVTTLFLLLCLPGAALNILLIVAMRCHGGDALRKLEHGLSYNAAAVNAAICIMWMPCHIVRCVASLASPTSMPAAAIYVSNCLLFLLTNAWLVTLCGMCVQRACRLFVSSGGRYADRLALGLVIASWTVAVPVAVLAAVEHRWLLNKDGHFLSSSDYNGRGQISLTLVATAALFVLTLIICLVLWLSSLCVHQLPGRQDTCGSDDTRETIATGANGDAALLTAGECDDVDSSVETKAKYNNSSKRRRYSKENNGMQDIENDNDDVDDGNKPSESVQLVGGRRTVTLSSDDDRESTGIPLTATMSNSSSHVKGGASTKRTTAVAEVVKQSSKKDETDDDDDELDDDAFDMQMRAKMQQSARTGDRRHTVANIGAEAGSFFGRRVGGGGGGGNRGGSGSSGSGVFSGLFSSSSGSTKERKPAGRPTNYNYARKFSVDLVALQNQLENPKKLGSMDVFQRPSRSQSDLKAAAAAVTPSEPSATVLPAVTAVAAPAIEQLEHKRSEEEVEQEQQPNNQKQRPHQIHQQHHMQQQQQRVCARQQQHRLSETAEEPEDASAAESPPTTSTEVSVIPAVSVSASQPPPLPPPPSFFTPAVTIGLADSCSSDFDSQTVNNNVATLAGSLSTSPLTTACGSTEPLAPASSDHSDKTRTNALFDEHQQIAACCKANSKGVRNSGDDSREAKSDRAKWFSPASKRARKDTRRLQGVMLAVTVLLACLLPWLLADFCLAASSKLAAWRAALRAVWAALSPLLFVVLLARADYRYARAFRKLADAYRRSRCICYCNVGSTAHPCCDTSSVSKT